MGEIIYSVETEKLFTGIADLQNATSIVKIPLSINIDGARTIGSMINWEGKEILISKFLRNKYFGKHISYYDTEVPLNFNRAFALLDLDYAEFKKKYDGSLKSTAESIYKEALGKDLIFLEKYLLLDMKLSEEIKNHIDSVACKNLGLVQDYLAEMELIELVLIPNQTQLSDLYYQRKWAELDLLLFALYKNIKLISEENWENRLPELSTLTRLWLRNLNEKM